MILKLKKMRWFGHVARANMLSRLCKILILMQELKCIRAGIERGKADGRWNVPKGIGRQLITEVHIVRCGDQYRSFLTCVP